MGKKIAIGLHTAAHASRLARLLGTEGIEVDITAGNVEIEGFEPPVTMEIDIEHLPSALRIIENIEIFTLEDEKEPLQVKPRKSARNLILGKKAATAGKAPVVVPVDFSEYSFLATRVAFSIARKLNARITLLHAYVLPSAADTFSLQPDTLAFEPKDMELDLTIEETAKSQMKNFIDKLKEHIKKGEIPPVKFDVEIQEGLPEVVINDYAREKDAQLIVMGTRGANKKERELIGSITAEVLDTVRFPIVTIPETADETAYPSGIGNALYFCNLDNDDITALNTMNRLFPDVKFNITLCYITSRKDKFNLINSNESLEKLTRYCRSKFPSYTFTSREIEPRVAKEIFTTDQKKGIEFIVVPNKKRNALTRLFNPGLAHRLLFVADIPMLVVPVGGN